MGAALEQLLYDLDAVNGRKEVAPAVVREKLNFLVVRCAWVAARRDGPARYHARRRNRQRLLGLFGRRMRRVIEHAEAEEAEGGSKSRQHEFGSDQGR